MAARVTRPMSHMGVSYKAGDVVENHDRADLFVRFGFAEPITAPAKAEEDPPDDSTDESSTTPRRRRAARSKEN